MAGSILQLDTELLKQAAAAAKTANDAITQAMNLINQVTEHQDWVCSKRDVINEYARNNRAAIGTLQESANSFYAAVQNAADRFVDKEQEIANHSNKLDEIISSVIVKVPGISGAIGSASGSVGMMDMGDIGSSISGAGNAIGSAVSGIGSSGSQHSSGGGRHG